MAYFLKPFLHSFLVSLLGVVSLFFFYISFSYSFIYLIPAFIFLILYLNEILEMLKDDVPTTLLYFSFLFMWWSTIYFMSVTFMIPAMIVTVLFYIRSIYVGTTPKYNMGNGRIVMGLGNPWT